MGPIASKMKSSSQSPVFITVMWSLTISSTTDCMIWVADSLTISLTISADTLTAGSLLDRELLKNKKDSLAWHLVGGHFQVFLCVVVWALFGVFSISSRPRNYQILKCDISCALAMCVAIFRCFSGCGVGIVKCLFNPLYYVICWLHPSATARNYPIFYHTRARFARPTKEK